MASVVWGSDLHLDHASAAARAAYLAIWRATPGRIRLLTGDIATARRLVAELRDLGAGPGLLYFVLGNHDHFGGSVAAVRDAVVALHQEMPTVHWLPPAGVVKLDRETALIGVDGWADGGFGDALATPLRMNDDRLIAELAAQPTAAAKLAVKRVLAEADAARLATLLARATAMARNVVVATHVPPFVESLPASGPLARPEWQPLLVCRATGEVLRSAAATHPEHRFLVLAGHTHAATDVGIAPNLRCIVASARYGAPTMRVIDTTSA